MNRELNQNFTASLTRGGDRMCLRVTDTISHRTVLEMDLTPEQFMDILSGHETFEGVPAWFIPEEGRRQIGRYSAVVTRTLGSRDLTQHDREEILKAWIKDVQRFFLGGVDEAEEPRNRGGGYGEILVTFRSWFDTKEEAENWRERTQKLLDTIPTPAELFSRGQQSISDETRKS